MVKRRKFYDILILLSSVFIAVWVPCASLFLNKESITYKHLVSPYVLIGVGLVVIFIASNIWKWIAEGHTDKLNLRDYLEFLHSKHLSHESGRKHPDYRITLFVPNIWEKKVRVYTRSGLPPKSSIKWNIKKSEYASKDEDYDGVVGYAWALGIFVKIEDLPDYNTCSDKAKKEYLKRTYISNIKPKRLNKLHWKARSYCCLVIINKEWQKVGALMMESKNANGLKDITPDIFEDAAKTLQYFFR